MSGQLWERFGQLIHGRILKLDLRRFNIHMLLANAPKARSFPKRETNEENVTKGVSPMGEGPAKGKEIRRGENGGHLGHFVFRDNESGKLGVDRATAFKAISPSLSGTGIRHGDHRVVYERREI